MQASGVLQIKINGNNFNSVLAKKAFINFSSIHSFSNKFITKLYTNHNRDIMDQDLMRIGVSLPEKLLGKFDEIILQRGYSSRSEGIRDAIRNYIVNYEWMNDVHGERVGVITIVYSHAQRGLEDNLTEIQHEYGGTIQSSLHVHLDQDNCLEVVVLRGEGQEVRKAAESMMALKGVKHVKLTTTSLGNEL